MPRVLAFEPDPTEFVALVANLKGSAGCVPNAVSDHDGEVTFFLANETGDSSLFQPSAQQHRKTKVQATTLDSYLASHDLGERKCRVLKVEAEGAEPEVLRGAKDLLARTAVVIADVGFERGPENSSTLPQVSQLMEEAGFDLVMLHKPRLVGVFHARRLR